MASLLLAAGCYESTQPLGPPGDAPLDRDLAGTWRCFNDLDPPKGFAHVLVVPFDRAQYYVEWREENKIERHRAYATKVKDAWLYNVVQIKSKGDAPPWRFLRVTTRADRSVSLDLVNGDAVKEQKDEAGALAEIRRRVGDESLYAHWLACTREG